MGAAWLVARVELRRRWASLLAVSLIVAVVTAAVLTAVVGAQRTSSSIERFRQHTGASDVTFQSDVPDTAERFLSAARGLPEVEAASARHLVNAFPLDDALPDIAVMTDPEGAYGTEIDRPLVIAGRMPRRDEPEEILLNELASHLLGLGVGDDLAVRTWTAEDLAALFDSPDFPGFHGPQLELHVVGVGRTPEELPGDIQRTTPFAIGSATLLSAHPDIGSWPPAVVLRLRGGAADVDAVTEVLAAERPATGTGDDPHYSAESTAAAAYVDTSQRTVDSLAAGLLLFAAGVAAAGAIAVAQAVNRQLAGAATSAETVGVLGMTRSQRGVALALPIVLASAAGAVAGALMSVALSPLLPIGLARRAEVAPGVWTRPGFLVAGTLAIVALVGAFTFAAARRSWLGAERSSLPRQPPALVRAATRAGAAPAVLTGVHMATDRRQVGLVPVRSAFIGMAIAVAGLLGAGVLVLSSAALIEHPAHWGWNWSTLPDYFGDGDISQLQSRLLEDDRVEAVGTLESAGIVLGDAPLTGYAMVPLKGDPSMTLLAGRLPVGPGEVALGQQTLDDLGVAIGDTVDALAPDGTSTRRVTVVGTAVLPPSEETTLDVGAVLTDDGLTALSTDEPSTSLTLRYPPGRDVASLEEGLTADYGLAFTVFAVPQPPGPVRNLAESRNIAVALAAFFGVLGASGLLHVLLVSTRRRRGQLAVLRALGFRRAQVRRCVLVQAVTVAVGAALLGIPAGLIAGRLLWRILVQGLGAVADPQTPWVLIVVAAPLAAAVAALLSWWPGSTAVQARPAAALRTE